MPSVAAAAALLPSRRAFANQHAPFNAIAFDTPSIPAPAHHTSHRSRRHACSRRSDSTLGTRATQRRGTLPGTHAGPLPGPGECRDVPTLVPRRAPSSLEAPGRPQGGRACSQPLQGEIKRAPQAARVGRALPAVAATARRGQHDAGRLPQPWYPPSCSSAPPSAGSTGPGRSRPPEWRAGAGGGRGSLGAGSPLPHVAQRACPGPASSKLTLPPRTLCPTPRA